MEKMRVLTFCSPHFIEYAEHNNNFILLWTADGRNSRRKIYFMRNMIDGSERSHTACFRFEEQQDYRHIDCGYCH